MNILVAIIIIILPPIQRLHAFFLLLRKGMLKDYSIQFFFFKSKFICDRFLFLGETDFINGSK